MNNYQEETLKEILKDVKIRCRYCHGPMIRVRDLNDDAVVGYSCQDCPHYDLFDKHVV